MREKVAESLIVAENFLDLSNEMNIQIREACVCMLSHFSHVRLFATLWTIARHYPLSIVPCRQEYWSGLPCPPPGDLPDPGTKPRSLALQVDSLPSEPRQGVRGVREACLIILGYLARRG